MKFFLLFFLLLLTLEANEKKLKVMITDWKPYYDVSNPQKPTGYAIDIFEAVAKKSNIQYEYIPVDNFAEVIKSIESGEGDIVPNIGISDKRLEVFLFTQPTDTFNIYIYKRKNSYKLKSKEDFLNRKVGVVTSNICSRIIKKYVESEIVYFDDYKLGIKELNAGVIDGFCYPEPLIQKELKTLGIAHEIIPVLPPLKEVKRGVGISKENFYLLSLFNEKITELKLSGEYEKIYSKHFGEKKTIELTKAELTFIILSLLGSSFTAMVVFFYISNKKKWLMTKETLDSEIKAKTEELEIQNRELRRTQQELKEQSKRDLLTNVKNRKAYNEKIEELINENRRYKKKFSFLMFDIDDFKQINDTYGHKSGDEVLIELSKCVEKHTRANDYLFRIGGEEFVILLCETDIEQGKIVSEKIRSSIEQHIKVKEKSITVSIGISECRENDSEDSIYKRVDNLMYVSKNGGKNRVSFD